MTIRVAEQEYCATNEQFYTLDELIRENASGDEFLSIVDRLKKGETVWVGGGAQPLTVLQAVKE